MKVAGMNGERLCEVVAITDLVRVRPMHALQEQVVRADTCPNCHTKTIQHRHQAGGYCFVQCGQCLHVYGYEANG